MVKTPFPSPRSGQTDTQQAGSGPQDMIGDSGDTCQISQA